MDYDAAASLEPVFDRDQAKDSDRKQPIQQGNSASPNKVLSRSATINIRRRKKNRSIKPIQVHDIIDGEVSDSSHLESVLNGDRGSTGDSPTISHSSTATFSRTGTPQPDHSISSALRTRIRSRLQTARERGYKSRIQSDQELELSRKVNAVVSSKGNWKSTIESIIDTDLNDSYTSSKTGDSINFFLNTFPESKGQSNSATSLKDEEASYKTTEESITDAEESKQLTDTQQEEKEGQLLMRSMIMSLQDLHIYQRDETVLRSRKERVQLEAKVLTTGSSSPLPRNIFYGREEGFDPESDGLYLESVPDHLSARNIDRLNQRLYRESGRKWFTDYVYFIFQFLNNYFTKWSSLVSGLKSGLFEDSLYQYLPSMNRREFLEYQERTEKHAHELCIKIISFRFEQHPLMTGEHLIATKLIDAHKNYNKIGNQIVNNNMKQKIDVLKRSLNNVLKTMDKRLDDQETKFKEARMSFYKRQLIKAFDLWTKSLKEYRTLLVTLLDSWEQLKEKRRNQGYSSTTLSLIYKEESNQVTEEEEKQVLSKFIEEKCEFLKMIEQEAYQKDMETYRKQLKQWKDWDRAQKRGSKQDGIRLVSSSQNESVESNLSELEDHELSKPVPPKPLDESRLFQTIKSETFLPDGRLPGEPRFTDFKLDFSNPLTDLKECPAFERKRRNKINRLKYLLQVTINSCSVKTSPANLDANFQIFWNQQLATSFSGDPRLRISLLAKSDGLNDGPPIATANFPIPSAINKIESEDSVDFTEIAPAKVDEESKIKAKCEYGAYWISDDLRQVFPPQIVTTKPMTIRKSSASLKEAIDELETLDPNDPETIELFKAIPKVKATLVPQKTENEHSKEVERPENCTLEKQLGFCDPKDLENDLRLRMIRLRTRGDSTVKGMPIPLTEREVPKSLLFLKNSGEHLSIGSPKGIETKRIKALSILTKVRSKLMNQEENTSDRPRSWEDLILEHESRGLRMSFTLLIPTFNRRPLHPSRQERKKIAGSLTSNVDVKLIITIMHGFNVPVRCENEANPPKMGCELDISYDSRVNPFVEAVFQRQTARTNRAEGAQPTWNETLSLRLKVPNDNYSPINLTMVADLIYLNLYDEIPIEEELDDDSSNLSQRLERRWLGSLKIPFSTLYLNSKIEGTFKLNTPPVLLGYEYDSRFFNLGQTLSSESHDASNTYLTLFLTIDPPLQKPEEPVIKCDSMESERLLQYVKRWESQCREEHPDREIRALAIDLNAHSLLVTRYIRPIKPPEALIQNLTFLDEAVHRVARFVSLLPSIPDNIVLPGLGDIWCSCDQFLEMLVGDEEEHAILLCNFFLYLGKRAGVVLGFGIPEGPTSYVIVWEYTGQEPSIWNPISGEKFSIRDSYIPLHAIGTIFTSENVYANVQKHDHPNRLNFDVTKTSHWKPLFNRKFPNPGLPSIQPEMINFEATDEEYVHKLQNELEKRLRESLMKWRKKSRTFFNRAAIQQIRKILPRLEKKLGRIQQTDLLQELHDILIVHKMIGFPLNMLYTTKEAATEAVYATGVHLIDERNLTFALAVYLHPYPCSVLSVWIYIAALIKND